MENTDVPPDFFDWNRFIKVNGRGAAPKRSRSTYI